MKAYYARTNASRISWVYASNASLCKYYTTDHIIFLLSHSHLNVDWNIAANVVVGFVYANVVIVVADIIDVVVAVIVDVVAADIVDVVAAASS